MSGNDERLAERLEVLETAVAHAESTIADLSRVLAEQWTVIDALKARVSSLSEAVDEVTATLGEPDPRKPPPHW